MKKWLVGSVLLFSSLAQAQMLCADILRDTGLKLTTERFEIDNQNDPARVPELTLELLQMTAKTLGESFNKKLTLEKGELLLGEEIGNGWSLEYEYLADRRYSQEVFRLAKISLVKPNGEKVLLEKKPTNQTGEELSRTRFNEMELGFTDIGAVTSHVPAVIQGALLKSFLKWAPHMEYLSRADLKRAAESKNSFALKAKRVLRSNKSYVGKIIKKQSFKFALLGFAMYLYYNEKGSIQDFLTNFKNPWSDIENKTNIADLRQIFPELKIGDPSLKRSTPHMDLAQAFQDVNLLMKKEKELGGKTFIFIHDGSSFKEFQSKKISKALETTAEYLDHAIVILMPTSGRVLVVLGQDDDDSQLRLLGVSSANYPEIYMEIALLLKSQSEMAQKK